MRALIYECNWGRDLRLWDVEKKAERPLGCYPFSADAAASPANH